MVEAELRLESRTVQHLIRFNLTAASPLPSARGFGGKNQTQKYDTMIESTQIEISKMIPTEAINWDSMPFELETYHPMIVTPTEDGKFKILDGHHRFMYVHYYRRLAIRHGRHNAMLDTYPCYVVNTKEERVAAWKISEQEQK